MIVMVERRRAGAKAATESAALTAAEEARLAEILNGEGAP